MRCTCSGCLNGGTAEEILVVPSKAVAKKRTKRTRAGCGCKKSKYRPPPTPTQANTTAHQKSLTHSPANTTIHRCAKKYCECFANNQQVRFAHQPLLLRACSPQQTPQCTDLCKCQSCGNRPTLPDPASADPPQASSPLCDDPDSPTTPLLPASPNSPTKSVHSIARGPSPMAT